MKSITNKNSLKIFIISTIFITLLFITFTTVYAQNMSGDNIVVESGQTLEKTSFLSGNNIRVDGNINATTFVAASNVEINGDIDGDLFIAAQSVLINGTVKGSIFTGSQNITINGNIENNIYSAGATVNLKAKTEGSAFLAGQNIYIEDEATIEKDVFVGGAEVFQNGVIDGDLNSSSNSLDIDGIIGGDLNYRSIKEANLSNDGKIEGNTNWTQIEVETEKETSYLPTILGIIFSILSALVVWLVIRLIRPTFWINFADKIIQKPLKTFGLGMLGFFIVPLIIVILMITIIGIPLSLIVLVLYLIALYISKIILSVFIAFSFQRKFNWSNAQVFWIFLLSIILISILSAVPILGWFIRFIIVGFGIGSIIYSLKKEPAISIPENQNFN